MRTGPDTFAEFMHSSHDGSSGREHVTVSRHLGDRVQLPLSVLLTLVDVGCPCSVLPRCSCIHTLPSQPPIICEVLACLAHRTHACKPELTRGCGQLC